VAPLNHLAKRVPGLWFGHGTANTTVVLVVVVVFWAVLDVVLGTVEKISFANFSFVLQHTKMSFPIFGEGFVGKTCMEKRPERIFGTYAFGNTGRVEPTSTIGRKIEPKDAALNPSSSVVSARFNSSISPLQPFLCSV